MIYLCTITDGCYRYNLHSHESVLQFSSKISRCPLLRKSKNVQGTRLPLDQQIDMYNVKVKFERKKKKTI